MRGLDLFDDIGQVAAEYGWLGLGQPQQHVRRYGFEEGGLQTTISVYANLPGTAIAAAERRTLTQYGPNAGERSTQRLGQRDGGKRDRVIAWLRRID